MIRVREGTFPLSHSLNDFHSQSKSVEDTLFAINKLGSGPPPPISESLYGVDKADPQPSSYPAETTFFLRTSASKPLFLGAMGSTYFRLQALKSAENVRSLRISALNGYTGTCKKIWDVGGISSFPLDLNAFVADPGTPFYLRFYDSFDPITFFRPGSPFSSVLMYMVPRSFAWKAGFTYSFTGKVIRFKFGDGWSFTVEYVSFPNVSLGVEWDKVPLTVIPNSSDTTDFVVFQSS